MILTPEDIEEYKKLLPDQALSEAEKEATVRAVWRIVETFVDLAWGLDPVTLAREARKRDRGRQTRTRRRSS